MQKYNNTRRVGMVPQIKDSITKMEHLHDLNFDSKCKHKNLIIFAGTKVVKTEINEDNEPLPKNVKIPPPIRVSYA